MQLLPAGPRSSWRLHSSIPRLQQPAAQPASLCGRRAAARGALAGGAAARALRACTVCACHPIDAHLHPTASVAIHACMHAGFQFLLPPHWQQPRSRQRWRRRTTLHVYSTSSWPPDDGPLAALLELRSKLKPLGLAFRQAVQGVCW